MNQRDFVQHVGAGITMFSGTPEECITYLRAQAPAQQKRLYMIRTEHLSVDDYLKAESQDLHAL